MENIDMNKSATDKLESASRPTRRLTALVANRTMAVAAFVSLGTCSSETREPSSYGVSGVVGTTVTSQGGLVNSPDGLMELVFPAGAVSEPIRITIDVVNDPSMDDLVSSIYRFGPAGIQFGAPVIARLSVPDIEASGRLVLANIDGPIPVPAEASTYSRENATLQATLRHFSSYGAFDLGDPCSTSSDCPPEQQCDADFGVCASCPEGTVLEQGSSSDPAECVPVGDAGAIPCGDDTCDSGTEFCVGCDHVSWLEVYCAPQTGETPLENLSAQMDANGCGLGSLAIECDDSEDCLPGQVCVFSDGEFGIAFCADDGEFSRDLACTEDSDCSIDFPTCGYFEDSSLYFDRFADLLGWQPRACVEAPVGDCNADAECGPGQFCGGNECTNCSSDVTTVCTADDDCDPGFDACLIADGEVYGICTSSSHIWTPENGCLNSADCNSGEVCLGAEVWCTCSAMCTTDGAAGTCCPEGSSLQGGECVAPTAGDLWSPCLESSDCQSGVCYQSWQEIDGEWTQVAGICSYLRDWSEQGDALCIAQGGSWYMPGCVSMYCLPACESDDDCPEGLSCGGAGWADPVAACVDW